MKSAMEISIEERFTTQIESGHKLLAAVHHGWPSGVGRRHSRGRGSRSRRGRDRHPLLRSGDGRPGDPTGVAGGPRRRGDSTGDPRRGGDTRRRDPAGGDDVLQHRAPRRPSPLRRATRRRRCARVHRSRPPTRGVGAVDAGSRRCRDRDDHARRPDGVRRTAASRRRACPRLRVLGRLARCDG